MAASPPLSSGHRPPPGVALALACLALVGAQTSARAQSTPCDDAAYVRQMKTTFPQAVDALVAEENARRVSWNARAEAISARIVAARATTPEGQSAYRLALWRRPDIASYDTRIAQAQTDFREHTVALQAAPLLQRVDPLHLGRGECVLQLDALQALRRKLDLETEQWSLVDRALVDEAARLGVALAP